MRLLLLLALVIAAAGCGTAATPAAWGKTAGQTTCAEWAGQMTPEMRTDLAWGMLEVAWERDGAGSRPTIDDARRFADGIGQVCKGTPTNRVSEVAGTLYTLADDYKPGR